MKVPRFVLTNTAKRDLIGIARFTSDRWGTVQRNKYLAQLDNTFHQLADAPMMEMECDFIKPGYRKFPVGSHIIFYLTTQHQIEIVRILHKHMDVSDSLFKS